MSTPTAMHRTPLGGPVARPSAGEPARMAMVRMVATSHIFAGAVLALVVAGNLALRINPTGGPMGVVGSISVGMAGNFNNMAHLTAWDAGQFAGRYNKYATWLSRHAQTSRPFFGLLAGVQVALAALCIAIGHGLRRRLRWALIADRILIGASAALATVHGVVLLASGLGFTSLGTEILATTAIVAGPILILLGMPGISALFEPSPAPGPVESRRRRWWTLSAEWLMVALACVLGLGIVRMFVLGPMVEVVWAGVELTSL